MEITSRKGVNPNKTDLNLDLLPSEKVKIMEKRVTINEIKLEAIRSIMESQDRLIDGLRFETFILRCTLALTGIIFGLLTAIFLIYTVC